MKIPNISRRYGGVDIKLKVRTRLIRLVVTALILVGGFWLCRMIYLLFDRIMNGFVVEWFEREYIQQIWVDAQEGLVGYYDRRIRWWKVKELLLNGFIGVVLVWLLAVRGVSILYAARQEKKTLRAAGQMIGDYMRHDREASEVFPGDYAEISAQMTEIKASMQRHEQILKEEASRKNDLITYLAHDLKTPLTSVVGYLSLLEEAPDLPPEQKERYVHITLEKALQLERLINEFFEITRYNLQQIVLEKESVNLCFMLVQMTDEFYPLLSAHGNTIRLDLPGKREVCSEQSTGFQNPAGQEPEDVTVYADREKLARVFHNVLKNAVAYSYEGTEIHVECRTEEDRAVIIFVNHGRTIPQQKLESIFEKFFRLDDARSTNTGGAGLGLAIAREIVTLHGGSITARSQKEETAFIVELPLYSEKILPDGNTAQAGVS